MAYSKYSAKPTSVDGIRFASKAESRRYSELKCLERAGIISHLELQPRFPLIVNGQHICTYVGDFRYVENGKPATEDVKGFKTDVYTIKKKLLLATHPGIDHREIGLKQTKAKREVSQDVKDIFREAAQRRRA